MADFSSHYQHCGECGSSVPVIIKYLDSQLSKSAERLYYCSLFQIQKTHIMRSRQMILARVLPPEIPCTEYLYKFIHVLIYFVPSFLRIFSYFCTSCFYCFPPILPFCWYLFYPLILITDTDASIVQWITNRNLVDFSIVCSAIKGKEFIPRWLYSSVSMCDADTVPVLAMNNHC